MKVKDAFTILDRLRHERNIRLGYLLSSSNRGDLNDHKRTYRALVSDIARIEELVYNMELEDSYDCKTLEFLNKYEEVII
jgi:hypothetical protein